MLPFIVKKDCGNKFLSMMKILNRLEKDFGWKYYIIDGYFQKDGELKKQPSLIITASPEDVYFNKTMLLLGKVLKQSNLLIKTPDENTFYVPTDQDEETLKGKNMGRASCELFDKFYKATHGEPFMFNINDSSNTYNPFTRRVKNIYKQGKKYLVKKVKEGKTNSGLFDTLIGAKRYLQTISKMVYRKYIK